MKSIIYLTIAIILCLLGCGLIIFDLIETSVKQDLQINQFVVADFCDNVDPFIVKIPASADLDKAKKLALEGFRQWFAADDDSDYWYVGYAEPSEELLKENGIQCEIDKCYDKNGEELELYKGIEVVWF